MKLNNDDKISIVIVAIAFALFIFIVAGRATDVRASTPINWCICLGAGWCDCRIRTTELYTHMQRCAPMIPGQAHGCFMRCGLYSIDCRNWCACSSDPWGAGWDIIVPSSCTSSRCVETNCTRYRCPSRQDAIAPGCTGCATDTTNIEAFLDELISNQTMLIHPTLVNTLEAINETQLWKIALASFIAGLAVILIFAVIWSKVT